MQLNAALCPTVVAMLFMNACAGRQGGIPAEPMPRVSGTPVSVRSVRYIDIKVGSGDIASPRKCVYTHYTGWLARGTRFESSHDLTPDGAPGEPVGFLLGTKQVIAGWDIGFEGMRVGGQRRLMVPSLLAYGENGRPPAIPPNTSLIFDVEVMAVADSLPRARSAASTRNQTAPVGQCPSWKAVNARR